MKKIILFVILYVAKYSGFFLLARRLTAKDLRILCYHGAALRDEDRFNPHLFINRSTFASRMDFLARKGYPVLTLDAAVDGIRLRSLPNCATVLTIDDGWYGTYAVMLPELRRYGFQATLYVATYYFEKQTQVFNIAAAYALWLKRDCTLDLAAVSPELSGTYELVDRGQRDKAYSVLNMFAEELDGEGRQRLFRSLCEALRIDWRQIEKERLCGFLNSTEAQEALKSGLDIQLHTHRHRFGLDTFEDVKKEIEDNRSALKTVSDRTLTHFCYPSGNYRPRQLPWLQDLGISSASTTNPGFNRYGDNPLELKRFLDSCNVTGIEFEAEMTGFFELVRRCGIRI